MRVKGPHVLRREAPRLVPNGDVIATLERLGLPRLRVSCPPIRRGGPVAEPPDGSIRDNARESDPPRAPFPQDDARVIRGKAPLPLIGR